MSRLHLISEPAKEQARGDVVFVHGTGGDWRTTWMADGGRDETFWPAWLAADLTRDNVWSLEYDARRLARGDGPLPLSPTAADALSTLYGKNLGERPIVFVCHSLGGLVVKKMLHTAHTLANEHWKPTARRAYGVVFFGTPHDGSDHATYASYLTGVISSSVIVQEQQADAYNLLELGQWYRDNATIDRVGALVYTERNPIRGLGTTVKRGSADPGLPGAAAVEIGGNHLAMCKLSERDSTYEQVLRFVGECLAREHGGLAVLGPPPPAPLTNLPPANPDFVGRGKELDDLLSLLAVDGPVVRTQAITGLGGVGKTQTALAYAHRHLADCHLAWWLRAETPATLAADYAAMAAALGLPEAAEADQNRQVAAVRRALEGSTDWLLVFDNAEEPVAVREYFPRTGNGRVLLTSRRTDWLGVARMFPLELMREPEAIQLLVGRSDPETLPATDLADAEELARELGCLPLALAQARAYIVGAGKSLADYLRLFRASRPEVLKRGLSNPDYPESVATTWQISVDAAMSVCTAARSLLEVLAFLAPDALPGAVLAAGADVMPEGLRGELERDDAVAALNRFSLIRAEGGSITTHRLVQAVTQDELGEATAETRAGDAVRLVDAAAKTTRPDEPVSWPAFATLTPHALAAITAAERLGAALEEAAGVANALVVYFCACASWGEAELLAERTIALAKKAFGPEDSRTATTISNVGIAFAQTGQYAKAEPLLKQALAIEEKASGLSHVRLAMRLDSLAQLHFRDQRYAEAKSEFLRAIKILNKIIKNVMYKEDFDFKTLSLEDVRHIPKILNNAGSFLDEIGKPVLAEKLYVSSIAMTEGMLGPNDLALSKRLNNIGYHYKRRGLHAEALPYLRRAVEIGEINYRKYPEHPDFVAWIVNLADLYFDMKRCEDAEPLYKCVLAIPEKNLLINYSDLAAVRERYDTILGQLSKRGASTESAVPFGRSQLYVDNSRPSRSPKIGRNAPCPCGSGRKYKRCCGAG